MCLHNLVGVSAWCNGCVYMMLWVCLHGAAGMSTFVCIYVRTLVLMYLFLICCVGPQQGGGTEQVCSHVIITC